VYLLLISWEEILGMTWNKKLFLFSLLGFYELYKYGGASSWCWNWVGNS
jgi:hypothetical protein